MKKLNKELPYIHPEILSHPHIPKPFHGLAPRTILGESWWDLERKAAYKKYNDRCHSCGIHKPDKLQGHEFYDIDYQKEIMIYKETVALCWHCHSFIHSGYSFIQYQQGKLLKSQMLDIIHHGFNILRNIKMKPFFGTLVIFHILRGMSSHQAMKYTSAAVPIPEVKESPDYSNWRMHIGDKIIQPRFKSLDEWEQVYG